MHFIEERIYTKLLKLMPDLENLKKGDAMKSKVPGFMDLTLDILEIEKNYLKIALSHYYKGIDGDLIPDPDMVIKIVPNIKWASSLTYQDSYIYDEVLVKINGETYLNRVLQNKLNKFLNQWLRNCLAQGHSLKKNSQ